MSNTPPQVELPLRKRAPRRTVAQQRAELKAKLADLSERERKQAIAQLERVLGQLTALEALAREAQITSIVHACGAARTNLTQAKT